MKRKRYDCYMDAIIGQSEDFDHVTDVRFTDDFNTEVVGEKYDEYNEYDYDDFVEEIDELDDLMFKSSIITDPKSRKG